jgi:hypothetical protein
LRKFCTVERHAAVQRADLAHADWRPRLAADVLWALALAHHWTPRLPDLEALLQRLGGLEALTGREAASALWAFATLGHVLTALLQVGVERWQPAGHFVSPWIDCSSGCTCGRTCLPLHVLHLILSHIQPETCF